MLNSGPNFLKLFDDVARSDTLPNLTKTTALQFGNSCEPAQTNSASKNVSNLFTRFPKRFRQGLG